MGVGCGGWVTKDGQLVSWIGGVLSGSWRKQFALKAGLSAPPSPAPDSGGWETTRSFPRGPAPPTSCLQFRELIGFSCRAGDEWEPVRSAST